jgi:hypothetical protein
MIDQLDVYKVLLPEWIFETAKDKAHLEQLVLKYMTVYPHYSVKVIKNRFAHCVRTDIPESVTNKKVKEKKKAMVRK